MIKITQAFIFAAGRGERMRPITDLIPKPLVKIKNKAIIDYAIEKLDQISSIKKIIINGFYLADQMADHIKKLRNPKIIFSHEQEKVETGGGLVFASNQINFDKPLLTLNGDILWQDDEKSDIEIMIKAWNSSKCDILLGLKKVEDYIGYEVNDYGGDFNLSHEKLFRFPEIKMTHAFVGMQIINPKILDNPPAKNFSMAHFYKSAIGENGLLHRINGVELKGRYFHIGTPFAIKTVEDILR